MDISHVTLEEGSSNLFPSSKSLMSPSLTILVPGTFQNSHITVLSEHAPALCHYPNALQGQQAGYPISDASDCSLATCPIFLPPQATLKVHEGSFHLLQALSRKPGNPRGFCPGCVFESQSQAEQGYTVYSIRGLGLCKRIRGS